MRERERCGGGWMGLRGVRVEKVAVDSEWHGAVEWETRAQMRR